jgi:hypothetical protein
MNKLAVLILSLSLAIPTPVYAKCEKQVKLLNVGDKAPCRGFLFSPEKELDIRIVIQESELQDKEIEYKDKKIKLLLKDLTVVDSIIDKERQKSELWRIRAEESTLKLVESEQGRGKRDFWFVVLGVALTVGAGYAVGQAAK